jgi:hypothetical protein
MVAEAYLSGGIPPMSITQFVSHPTVRSPRRRFCGQNADPCNPPASPIDLSLQQDLLQEILPNALLEKVATLTKAQDQRKRKLTCVIFFWLMVLVVGPGGPVNLAQMTNHLLVAGTLAGISISEATLSRQALSENLKLRSWQFFAVILDHLLGIYAALAGLNAPVLDLELIQYLRLVDSSTLRVADCLIQTFPGHRTGRKQEWAAIKLHAAFRFFRSIPEVLALTAENINDKSVNFLLPKDQKTLYVFDLGYWKYALLDEIIQRTQHFICRLQKKCNPLIQEVYRGDPAWIGKRFFEVCLDGFTQIDLRVNVSSTGPSNPKMKHDVRLVGEIVECCWRFYLTSILDHQLYPVDLIAQIYALRWQIELFFRNLKCVLRMQNLIALTENGVRIQIYAALIDYVLTHILMLKAAAQTQIPFEDMSVPKCLQVVGQVLMQTADLVVKDHEPNWKEFEQCLISVIQVVHRRAWRKSPSRLSQATSRVLAPPVALRA